MRRLGPRLDWRPVAAWWAVVLAAAGGNAHTTRPGGESLTGSRRLIGIDDDAVPAVAQMENCTPSRFRGGAVSLAADGTWRLDVDWDDEYGRHVLRDGGWFRRTRNDLSFHSDHYGDDFAGSIRGEVVLLRYDFCGRNQADLTFAFAR
jgi:hypothetical protein